MAVLRRHQYLVAYLVLVSVLVIGLIRVELLAHETHTALCTFKQDAEHGVESGERYIRDVEAGRRPIIPGFTINELERMVADDRTRLAALSSLDC